MTRTPDISLVLPEPHLERFKSLFESRGFICSSFPNPSAYFNESSTARETPLVISSALFGSGGNGFSFCRRVTDSFDVKVILCSFDDLRFGYMEARRCGASSYFHNPLDGSEASLIESVKSLLPPTRLAGFEHSALNSMLPQSLQNLKERRI